MGAGVEWSRAGEASASWLTRIFGCWHREMSRPLTLRASSYRVCMECGAHRRFNTQTWEMTGPYYYEQASPLAELYRGAGETVRVMPARRAQPAPLRAAA
ncbi:MAG: hypothetical protein QOF02_3420 [Blastocatellia bacterium]|nr:hypothetical protein [Blastocatellia bacterium]